MQYLSKFLHGNNEIINNLQAGQSLVEQDKAQLEALFDWLDTMLYIIAWSDKATAKEALAAEAYAYVEVHGEQLIGDMRTLLKAIKRQLGLDALQREIFLNQYLVSQGLPPVSVIQRLDSD